MPIVLQWTINEKGEIVKKRRPCHDLKFYSPFYANSSINKRHILSEIPETQHGFAISRILTYIMTLRLKHPNTPILLSKFDVEGAYKRISLY